MARAEDSAATTALATSSAALPEVGEVVVTAERHATKLARTPVSVGVVNKAELQDRNLQTLRDIAGTISGLQIPAASTPSLSYIFIRGIGTTSPTYDSAVGIYIDDVYVARVINSGVFGLPDIERMEVLRGPQGTLYGLNTSAGALRVISATPSDKFSGWAAFSAGDFGQYEGRFYVTGPIIKGVLDASLAYSHQENSGYTYDVTLGKHVNRIHTDQARLKLRFTPPSIPNLETTLSVQGLLDHSDNAVLSPLNVPNPKPSITYENLDTRIHDKNVLVSLVNTYKLNDQLTLKSISGYRHFNDNPDPWSQDGLATNIFEWQLNLDQTQISQELQLLGNYGRLTFTAGAIGYQELFNVSRPNVTLGVYGGIASKTLDNNAGVYAQAHYAITKSFGATLGLRYSVDDSTYGNTGFNANPLFQPTTDKYVLTGLKYNSDALTPKLGLDYQVNKALFVYGSITSGEKEGGYNPVAGTASIASVPVKAESVTAYEVGAKTTAWNHRFQTSTSLFYNDFHDYQSLLTNPYINGVLVNGSVAINAQKATTYGVEFETTVYPTPSLELQGNATLMNAKFDKFTQQTSTGVLSYTGNQLPYPSKVSLGASAVYQVPLAFPGTLKVRGDIKYLSSAYADITNVTKIPPYSITDMGAFYTTEDGKWTGFLTVKNAFNRIYAYAGIPKVQLIPGVLATAYSPPRMFQIGLRRDF